MNLLPDELLKQIQKLKNSSSQKINPRKWLQKQAELDQLHTINMAEDARQCLDISRRELEAQAKDRQPNMSDSEGDDMGSQVGDNITINLAPEPVAPLASKAAGGLAKVAVGALLAGTPIGLGLGGLGYGLSMIGGDTNSVVEENLNPESLRLGPPIVKPDN